MRDSLQGQVQQYQFFENEIKIFNVGNKEPVLFKIQVYRGRIINANRYPEIVIELIGVLNQNQKAFNLTQDHVFTFSLYSKCIFLVSSEKTDC